MTDPSNGQSDDSIARELDNLLHDNLFDPPDPSHNGHLPLPPIVSVHKFMSEMLVKPPEIVHGILHKGSKLALGGGSKSFKTWTLLDLAVSVANGIPWLGFGTVQGKVLYCNFEIPTWSWQRRIATISEARSVDITEDSKLHLWNLRGRADSFVTFIPKIRDAVKQEFSLIILDPIYKIYGSTDENKAGDVAKLLNEIEGLCVESEAATVWGNHFSKGNQSTKIAIDRFSGSGVFARDPDSLLTFTPHTEPDSFIVESSLRNFPPIDPFVVSWSFPLMSTNQDLSPFDFKKQGGATCQANLPDLLALIENTTPESPISISDWAALAKLSRTTLANYARKMRENGWIKTIGEGTASRRYITSEGLGLLPH